MDGLTREELQKEMAKFAKFIYDEHTDQYGMLQISNVDDGEFCLSSFETVAEDYISMREKQLKK